MIKVKPQVFVGDWPTRIPALTRDCSTTSRVRSRRNANSEAGRGGTPGVREPAAAVWAANADPPPATRSHAMKEEKVRNAATVRFYLIPQILLKEQLNVVEQIGLRLEAVKPVSFIFFDNELNLLV